MALNYSYTLLGLGLAILFLSPNKIDKLDFMPFVIAFLGILTLVAYENGL